MWRLTLAMRSGALDAAKVFGKQAVKLNKFFKITQTPEFVVFAADNVVTSW